MKKLLSSVLALVPALALAGPSAWNVDASHSTAGFAVKHLVISTVRGEFATLSGKVVLDDADPARSTVDASIDVNSITTRVPDRDAHLKSPDFLDAAKYPTMRLLRDDEDQPQGLRPHLEQARRGGPRGRRRGDHRARSRGGEGPAEVGVALNDRSRFENTGKIPFALSVGARSPPALAQVRSP